MFDGVRTEQLEQRNRNGAQLVQRDMGGAGLQALREHDPDPVTCVDTLCAQTVGQAVGLLLQGQKAVVLNRAIGIFLDDRNAFGVVSPAVTASPGNIETLRSIPLRVAGRERCRVHGRVLVVMRHGQKLPNVEPSTMTTSKAVMGTTVVIMKICG